PSYFMMLKALVVTLFRRIGYFRHRDIAGADLPKGKFVYFPLHASPESSTLTLSDTLNEVECVFQLSKALPVDWKIVLKPNPSMLCGLDDRPNQYYLDMSKLPNVQFVSPLVPTARILPHASAVACLAGTTLLEAAIYDKPSLRWGHVEFEIIDSIKQFSK